MINRQRSVRFFETIVRSEFKHRAFDTHSVYYRSKSGNSNRNNSLQRFDLYFSQLSFPLIHKLILGEISNIALRIKKKLQNNSPSFRISSILFIIYYFLNTLYNVY